MIRKYTVQYYTDMVYFYCQINFLLLDHSVCAMRNVHWFECWMPNINRSNRLISMFQQQLIGNWMKIVENVDGQVMNGTFIYSRMQHCRWPKSCNRSNARFIIEKHYIEERKAFHLFFNEHAQLQAHVTVVGKNWENVCNNT